MATPHHRVEITEGVVYGQGGGRDLRCDVYRPEGLDGPLPAVVLLHGGSWRTGDRTQLKGYGILLGREGYICVAPEYRLLGEAPWPAQIDDVRAAVEWARKNADELGIDPARVAVEGNSAGAHLALLLASDPSLELKACIAIYPPTHLLHEGEASGAVPLWALIEDEGSLELERQASPIHNVTPAFPPTKLIHGTADTTVPVSASFRMYEKLHENGVPTDLHIFADQPHAFDAIPPFGRQVASEMLLFLERYVPKHS